jgi:sugar-specific transcriptional regulator TrmB
LSVSDRTWKALKDLGLTQYEIKAYVALLATGPIHANIISKEAEVPYSKIYEVLGNLEKKGWIETDHDRPARYFPKSPSMALDTVKTKVESEIRRNENQVISELQPLFEDKESREKPSIWIVHGDFNILTRIRQTLLNCEKELLLVIPNILGEVVDLLTPSLSTLKNRSVKLTILTIHALDTKVLNRLAYLSELRVRDQMFGGGVISDAREVILLLGDDEKSSSSIAICSEHPGLAKLAKSYFTYLWDESKPYG